MDITVQYEPNAKQSIFHSCSADEAVYGGAKGGGKSCALVMESLAYGLENAGAEMYIFRETYDDLEANIIREWKEKVPRELYSYNESKHFAALINGTTVKFRYIRNYADAEGYQGRSMDWIGVDELTKHEKRSIQVLLSCLRSPKGFKPRFRGTCNPGGIGHSWVKEDYIEATGYGIKEIIDPITGNKRAFIPAKVYDNDILMKNDPAYVRRLENLPEDQKKAFLHGDWDIFTGQYFSEFRRDIHVIDPFIIPAHWRRYIVLDYGLDMLAAYWIAVDEHQKAYVYKELYQSGLIVSEAAKAIIDITDETIYQHIAPPDLWNKNRDTGKSTAEIFGDNGIWLTQADNNRVQGWYNLKEWLKPYEDEQGSKTASLVITKNCVNLIRTLPQLQYDERNPNDVATEPHELTHGPDAIRYFIAGRPAPTILQLKPKKKVPWQLQDDQGRSGLDIW
jgi:phage terminase large subunit